ncbi:hypothetical protein [Natrinema sp. 1APR25-10V2]|uniref:hypothetical protein n=1 Tax=Natrinema sp. 1APR25-10V2 TaxID=2951081 RepID=UPI002876EB1A|nr:hypothetical protein [Natrinema sp. 1APR25-10V2]MDS0473742.1 hypothetical protein [Natrinema sp. 1APR25-10V2]
MSGKGRPANASPERSVGRGSLTQSASDGLKTQPNREGVHDCEVAEEPVGDRDDEHTPLIAR